MFAISSWQRRGIKVSVFLSGGPNKAAQSTGKYQGDCGVEGAEASLCKVVHELLGLLQVEDGWIGP